MDTYIGIDLGTSGLKLLLVDELGQILAENTQEYAVFFPHPGWSEQNPEDWFSSTLKGLNILLANQDRSKVKGISFGGQMHGLVALDEFDNVIRPAILWNDGRTALETDYLNNVIGKDKLSSYTANIAFAGFTAPKLLWMEKNEPENYKRIRKIMLPKDYLMYRLCGVHATDLSDASGTLLLDVRNRCWSKAMCDICKVDTSWLPTLFESYEAVAPIKPELAQSLNLNNDCMIVAGAGDNAAAAVGTATVDNGSCNISLGTSGTVFISSDKFSVDNKNALHSFCHSNGKYHLMACILSAASCNKWWNDEILLTKDYSSEQEGLEELIGENDIYFLPYLMGERSPHNDVNAKSAFIGMRPNTTRKQMTLAVLEGVAYALRDCVEVARENGIIINSTKICGGGAKSKLWLQIIANVLNMNVEKINVDEGPSYGAAILAMVGTAKYKNVSEACSKLVRVTSTVKPDKEIASKYDNKYQTFKKLYPALKSVFN